MADVYIIPSLGSAPNNNQDAVILQSSGNPLGQGTGDVTYLGLGAQDGFRNNFNSGAGGAPVNRGG